MKRLFIAEKPSVKKAIAGILGGGKDCGEYIQCGDDMVANCVGHILEMAMPEDYDEKYKLWNAADLPIIPKAWKMLPKSEFKKKLSVMKELMAKADLIVHAGDGDNEGQLLVDEVLEYLGNKKPVVRYWSSAPDDVSVRRALEDLKPNANYRGKRDAAEARGRVDWLIGMNLTRAYTLRSRRGGGDGVKPVGRVQTPTLAMVVARDRAIANFKPVGYHTLTATIEHAKGNFKAIWKPKEMQEGLDEEKRLVKSETAAAIVKATAGRMGKISEYSKIPKSEGPPRTWSLNTLTLAASNKWGYTAQQVLDACQSLYETHKLASYPRSDCDYLPESQFADAPAVLAAIKATRGCGMTPDEIPKLVAGADARLKSKTWDDKKITAHHGIIPTMHHGQLGALDLCERDIYDLIVRAYLAQFYPAHEYLATSVEVVVENECFKATGRTPTLAGWKSVFQEPVDETEEKETEEGEGQTIPAMAQGDPAKCAAVTNKSKKTKPPKAFGEGTLMTAMENIHLFVSDPEEKKLLKEGEGIGTPATQPAIITELKRRKFLVPKGKNKIVSSELGQALIDSLPPSLTSPTITAVFQRGIKDIEHGKATGADFLAGQLKFVAERVADANAGATAAPGGSGEVYPCPTCGKPLARRNGKFGFYWSCTGWVAKDDPKNCPQPILPDADGKPGQKKAQAAVVDEPGAAVVKCPNCGKGMTKRASASGKGHWWGCSGFPKCKTVAFPDSKGNPEFKK